MNPGLHLIGMKMCAWLDVFRVVEQRGVEVPFVGILNGFIEHRRATFPTKTACVPWAAFIALGRVPNEFPATMLLSDPRCERRGRCTAAAFTMDGKDLFVADRGTVRLFVFHNVGPGAAGRLVLDASDGISDLVGIAISTQQLFVVGGSQPTVRAYDLPAVSFSREFQFDSQPSALESVPGSTYYRLIGSPRPNGELWLLNTQSPISVFFVGLGQ